MVETLRGEDVRVAPSSPVYRRSSHPWIPSAASGNTAKATTKKTIKAIKAIKTIETIKTNVGKHKNTRTQEQDGSKN
jgi:hypothetical protein